MRLANFAFGAVAIVGIAAGILYFEPLIKRLANNAVLEPRRGRVIDSKTVQGLPDVIVIRKWFTAGVARPKKQP